MTQPALSRLIQRLEEQIGEPLFERRATGMRLSPAGTTLLPYAELIVSESERAAREIKSIRGLEKGVVRIGAVASALEMIVPEAINRVLNCSATLQFQVEEGLTDDLVRRLIKGDVELIVTLTIPESEQILLVAESDWQSGCHVVAANNSRLREKGGISVKDLMGHRWVVAPTGTHPWSEWANVFRTAGLPAPETVVETHSVATMRRLVSDYQFLGWMPDALTSGAGNASQLSMLKVEGVRSLRHFGMYRRRLGVLSVAAIRMIEEIQKVLQELPAVQVR